MRRGSAACRYFSGTNQYSLLNMHWWNDMRQGRAVRPMWPDIEGCTRLCLHATMSAVRYCHRGTGTRSEPLWRCLGSGVQAATEHTCRAARPPVTPPIEARAQVVFNLAEHARRGVQVMRVFGFFNGNGTVRAALAAWRPLEGGGLLGCILPRRHIVSGSHVNIRIFALALRAVKIYTTDLAFHTKQDTPRGTLLAHGQRAL